MVLSAQVALEGAAQLTGLPPTLGEHHNFYMDGIQLINTSMLEECKPTFAGVLSAFRTFRQYCLNIMIMNEMEKEHPAILQQEIIKPIIICGLNRTGTTFLQNLLSKDPSQRSTMYVEMLMPYGVDGCFRKVGISNDELWESVIII